MSANDDTGVGGIAEVTIPAGVLPADTTRDGAARGITGAEHRTPAAPSASRGKRLAWFVALWVGGVMGAALLALPFKIIIAFAR